jgi:alpha-glucosidase
MLLLTALRGNIFVYQGEELGLPQVDIPFNQLRDPEAIANWPLTLGRDGARTPMPWCATAPNAGFSTAEPWLPLGPEHAELAVDRQTSDPTSQLSLTRRLIALRRRWPALRVGSASVETTQSVLAIRRTAGDQQLLCVFNLGLTPIEWSPQDPDGWRMIEEVNGASAWRFPAYSGLIAERKG